MYQKYFKRLVDLTISFIGLIIFFPLLLFLFFLIRIKLGSPVFFIQDRPGLNGKKFKIIKFRTMRLKSDKFKKIDDDAKRITKLGSTLRALSLDELPQLWNVLRGEMSLVGPRPLLLEYLNLYTSNQMKRHDVLPGITGLAQVNGRNRISWKKTLKLDLLYVRNYSLCLDLKILFLTIIKVIKKDGISSNNSKTRKKYYTNENVSH